MNNKNLEQTYQSFKNKWTNNQELAFTETSRENSSIQEWIFRRNGFSSTAEFTSWLSDRSRILDAGCGNGRVTSLIKSKVNNDQKIVAIDLTAAEVAKKNLSNLSNVEVHEKDLLGDLGNLGKFDLIYCQEVLHHTADPFSAFTNLCGLLNRHGEIAIYVYKKKAPMREYADDFIRNLLSSMPYEEAVCEMEKITELGKRLQAIDAKIEVPDIKLLDIEAGEYDIQRFVYHFFLKCFWNPALSKDENIAINYDWYHPTISSRHTPEEVKDWFSKNAIEIKHFYVDHYGITARGVPQ